MSRVVENWEAHVTCIDFFKSQKLCIQWEEGFKTGDFSDSECHMIAGSRLAGLGIS